MRKIVLALSLLAATSAAAQPTPNFIAWPGSTVICYFPHIPARKTSKGDECMPTVRQIIPASGAMVYTVNPDECTGISDQISLPAYTITKATADKICSGAKFEIRGGVVIFK